MNWLDKLTHDETGATAAEYGLIAALIAGVIVITVIEIGPGLNTLYELVTNGWPG
ncbi:Flp family type IVb pilin [Myxococcota bacterium]